MRLQERAMLGNPSRAVSRRKRGVLLDPGGELLGGHDVVADRIRG